MRARRRRLAVTLRLGLLRLLVEVLAGTRPRVGLAGLVVAAPVSVATLLVVLAPRGKATPVVPGSGRHLGPVVVVVVLMRRVVTLRAESAAMAATGR